MVAASLVAALDTLARQPERLWTSATYLRTGLQRLGFNTGASVTPIITVTVGAAERATALSRALRPDDRYAAASGESLGADPRGGRFLKQAGSGLEAGALPRVWG